jgi:hypothetical protein
VFSDMTVDSLGVDEVEEVCSITGSGKVTSLGAGVGAKTGARLGVGASII